jgi:hypothetical protein
VANVQVQFQRYVRPQGSQCINTNGFTRIATTTILREVVVDHVSFKPRFCSLHLRNWETGNHSGNFINTYLAGNTHNGAQPTVYVTKGRDGRQTVTTVLPGFAWPTPITSYVNGNQGQANRPTITVTQSRRPTQNYPQESWPPPWETQPSRPRSTPVESIPRTRPPLPKSTSIRSRPPIPTSTPRVPKPTQQLPDRPTSTRPNTWTPPVETGIEPTWTPVTEPVIPVEQPQTTVVIQEPEPTQIPVAPIPTPSSAPETSNGPQKCGPSFGKCATGTYCDPQPLCSIGEDCDGVCFAVVTMRGVSLPNVRSI